MFKNSSVVPENPCPNCSNELHPVKDSDGDVCVHGGDVKFDCFFCGCRYSFMSVPNNRYDRLRSVFCDTCGKHFPHSNALKRHTIVHSADRPFCCEECDKSFKTKAALKRHSIIHTGECPFECSTCKRRFNQISNLRKHLVIHSNNCPFYCKVCGKGFNQLSNMKKHFGVHREEELNSMEEDVKNEVILPDLETKTVNRPVLTFVKAADS